MFITKTSLPRRTFLRGVGTMLALPLLDGMVPAASALAQTAARPVRRLGFVYIPMGANAAQWVPSADGRITELSPSLQSLTSFCQHASSADAVAGASATAASSTEAPHAARRYAETLRIDVTRTPLSM